MPVCEDGGSKGGLFPRVECHFRLKRVSLDLNPLLRQNSILTARESGRGEEDADYFLKLEIDLLGIEKKILSYIIILEYWKNSCSETFVQKRIYTRIIITWNPEIKMLTSSDDRIARNNYSMNGF